jgi:hypothetical protein
MGGALSTAATPAVKVSNRGRAKRLVKMGCVCWPGSRSPTHQPLCTRWQKYRRYAACGSASIVVRAWTRRKEIHRGYGSRRAEQATNAEPIETPYDVEARYRNEGGRAWVGYTVHLSESCDAEQIHLLTHVHTTPANVAEAKCTATIQQALVECGRAPKTHLADAGYVAADLLVESVKQRGITLVGPVRDNGRW